MDETSQEQLIARLRLELEKEREDRKRLLKEHGDQQSLARRLARANAESAELMAELEIKNQELSETNLALARANAHAAELMATIVLKDESIAESENRLKVILSQLPALVWTLDKDMAFTSIHGTLHGRKPSGGFFRCSAEEIVGIRVSDAVYKDAMSGSIIQAHIQALKGINTEFEYQKGDTYYYCHVEPLYTQGGVVRGAIGIAQDVSSQKEAERNKVLAARAAETSRLAEQHIREFKSEIRAREEVEAELRSTLLQLEKTLEGSIRAMAQALEVRDAYTAGHQRRVAKLSKAIAEQLNLGDKAANQIYLTALIHDIGKIAIPAEILSKPSKLSAIEFQLVKTHSTVGYDLLKSLTFPWPIADIIRQHHEWLDGSGYPDGLKGEAISLEARIISVADVVEAVASHRPYRPALGLDTAFKIISEAKGIKYDPKVVDSCLFLFREKGFTLD